MVREMYSTGTYNGISVLDAITCYYNSIQYVGQHNPEESTNLSCVVWQES